MADRRTAAIGGIPESEIGRGRQRLSYGARDVAGGKRKKVTTGHQGEAPKQVHRRVITGGNGVKDRDDSGVIG